MIRSLLFIALLAAPLAWADTRGFAWDYPASAQAQVDGYRLYCGTSAGQYGATPAATVNATTLTATANFPAGSSNFCVVRAYKGTVESAPSNEIAFPGRPDVPLNLRLVQTFGWDAAQGRYVARAAVIEVEQ